MKEEPAEEEKVSRRAATSRPSSYSGEEADGSWGVYMVCIIQVNRIGIAYYDATSGQLQATEIWEDANDSSFPTIQMLKYQLRPSVIYTNTRTDDQLLAALIRPADGIHEFEVKILKSSLFGYEQAKQRLLFLRWNGMPDHLTDRNRLHLLNSKISLDNEVQIRAAGGLLAILYGELVGDGLGQDDHEYDSAAIHVSDICQISIKNYLTLDAASYDALQIFHEDQHPSCMGIGKAKEG